MNKPFLLENRKEIYKKYNKMVITSFSKKGLLGEGEQGKIYRYCENDDFCVAVKKIYLDKKISYYINKINSKRALKETVFVALFVNKLINKVLLNGLSPNFIFCYNNHFEERSGACYEDYPYSSYFYNEFIDNSESFASWVYKKRSLKMLYSAFFQIISAIFTVQKQFKLQHLDMHAENILVKKIPKGGYFKYIINNIEYNIPNLGYLFVINDYGYASIPNSKNKAKDREYDVNFILNDVKADIHIKIINDIKYIVKNLKSNKINFEDLISEIWGDMYRNPPKNSKLLEIYQPDKHIRLESKIEEIIKNGVNN